jgi:hypothetical protein
MDDGNTKSGPPAVLVVTVEVDESDVDELNHWYEAEHRPEKLSLPGYRSMRRFRAADGSAKFLAVYELDDAESGTTLPPGGYNPSDWMQQVMSKWKHWERAVWVELPAGNPEDTTS